MAAGKTTGLGDASGLSELTDAIQDIVQAISGATGPMQSFVVYLDRAVQSLQSVPAALTTWVQALNPATVDVLMQAFRDLAATIGYAFEPVIQAVTVAVRDFAGELRPVMDSLRPVIADLVSALLPIATTLFQVFATVLKVVVDVLNALMPVIKLLAAVFEGLAAALSVFIQIVAALLGGMLDAAAGTDYLAAATNAVKDAFVQFLTAVITATDALLRLAGMGEMADRILRGFVGEDKVRRPAAPRNVTVGGLEDVYRRRLTEAARAGGSATPLERQVSIMEQIREHCRNMQDAQKHGQTVFDAFTVRLLNKAVDVLAVVSRFMHAADPLNRIPGMPRRT